MFLHYDFLVFLLKPKKLKQKLLTKHTLCVLMAMGQAGYYGYFMYPLIPFGTSPVKQTNIHNKRVASKEICI